MKIAYRYITVGEHSTFARLTLHVSTYVRQKLLDFYCRPSAGAALKLARHDLYNKLKV